MDSIDAGNPAAGAPGALLNEPRVRMGKRSTP